MKAEKHAARFAIMPILQAEEDRRYVSLPALVKLGTDLPHTPSLLLLA